jgi:hypothetical protein
MLAPGNTGGGVFALAFGCLGVAALFFTGPLVQPGGFGFSRWLSGFMDVVSIPALIPLILYLLFVEMTLLSPGSDHAGFALMWLVPLSAFRAMQWISVPSPATLVLVPVLWSALALGMPAMLALARKCADADSADGNPSKKTSLIVLLVAAMVILPFAAATSWWAFFTNLPVLGAGLLALTCAPALVSLCVSFGRLLKGKGTEEPDFLPGDLAAGE